MINIVIGNIVALIGSLFMVYSGIIKNKKKTIYVQTVQIVMSIISNIILGGITGAIINTISCIRNILCYKDKLRIKEKVVLIALSTTLSLFFNNLGFIGILPLISTITYTTLMDIKDVTKYKVLVIFTMILWCTYDIYIKSYSSAIFYFLNIITNSVAIYQLNKINKNSKMSEKGI